MLQVKDLQMECFGSQTLTSSPRFIICVAVYNMRIVNIINLSAPAGLFDEAAPFLYDFFLFHQFFHQPVQDTVDDILAILSGIGF